MSEPGGLIVGLLLAAGASRRFGADKLLAPLHDGRSVAVAACTALAVGVDRVVAVVRVGDVALRRQLQACGATVLECTDANLGMGASLAFGIAQSPAAGWLIALADMPFIDTGDVARVADALRSGAPIAALGSLQDHAHPVGFSARFGRQLTQLSGDRGARALLVTHPNDVVWLPSACAASQRDIDTVQDWQSAMRER